MALNSYEEREGALSALGGLLVAARAGLLAGLGLRGVARCLALAGALEAVGRRKRGPRGWYRHLRTELGRL